MVFYYDNGFLNVHIDQPQIASADRAMIAIDEGPLYRVGSIAIEGQLKFPRREVESQLTMRSGQPFRGSTLQLNALALEDFYSDWRRVRVEDHVLCAIVRDARGTPGSFTEKRTGVSL